MFIRLIVNIFLGYILGFIVVGFGFPWIINIETPWTTALVGAFIGGFLTLVVNQDIIRIIKIILFTVSVTGFLMLSICAQTGLPLTPFCPIATMTGLILGIYFARVF